MTGSVALTVISLLVTNSIVLFCTYVFCFKVILHNDLYTIGTRCVFCVINVVLCALLWTCYMKAALGNPGTLSAVYGSVHQFRLDDYSCNDSREDSKYKLTYVDVYKLVYNMYYESVHKYWKSIKELGFHHNLETATSIGISPTEVETSDANLLATSKSSILAILPSTQCDLQAYKFSSRCEIDECKEIQSIHNEFLKYKAFEQLENITDESVYSKTCNKCRLVKVPGAHHCSKCKTCVMKMDHHCYWLNNCIGSKNYKYFYLLLVYSFVLGFFHVSVTIYWFFMCINSGNNKLNAQEISDITWELSYHKFDPMVGQPAPKKFHRASNAHHNDETIKICAANNVVQSHSDNVVQSNSDNVVQSNSDNVVQSHSDNVVQSHCDNVVQSHCDNVVQSHSDNVVQSHCDNVVQSHCDNANQSHCDNANQSHCDNANQSDAQFADKDSRDGKYTTNEISAVNNSADGNEINAVNGSNSDTTTCTVSDERAVAGKSKSAIVRLNAAPTSFTYAQDICLETDSFDSLLVMIMFALSATFTIMMFILLIDQTNNFFKNRTVLERLRGLKTENSTTLFAAFRMNFGPSRMLYHNWYLPTPCPDYILHRYAVLETRNKLRQLCANCGSYVQINTTNCGS